MRRGRTGLVLVALALLVALAGCQGAPPSVSEYSGKVVWTEQQQAALLDAARKGMETGNPTLSADWSAIGGAGATVEIFLPPSNPIVVTELGSDFPKAFAAAVSKVVADTRFGSFKADLTKARIKVGIIDSVTKISLPASKKSKSVLRKVADQTENAVSGFILVKDGKVGAQVPEMALYKGWAMKGETRYMGWRLVKRQLRALSQAVTGDRNAWMQGELYAFTTKTVIDAPGAPGKPVELFRGKNMLPPLDAETIRAGAVLNADYLARVCDERGKFWYIYWPNEDEIAKNYGIVRHAGSAYGLFEAYNHLKDPKYADAGRRALNYLLALIDVPAEAPEIAIVKERGRSVLGTNALAAMAYAVMPDEFMNDKDKEFREKLGQSILYYRMPEKGLFYTYFEQARDKKPPKEQARYYPGEAMLALVRLHEKTGDKKWYDAAADLAPGQKKLWLDAGHNSVGDYCWVGQAFARMARLEQDPALRAEYQKNGYSHADAVIQHQFVPGHPKGYYDDYLGGADNSRPPRTTPTSARGESLAENYLTAKALGDVESQKKYGIAVLRAIHFWTQNQFTDVNSYFLPYPEKAKGGIRGSLIANDLRIDYNQHALAAQLNALDVPADLKALGVTW